MLTLYKVLTGKGIILIKIRKLIVRGTNAKGWVNEANIKWWIINLELKN